MFRTKIVIVDKDQAYLKALNNYFFIHKLHSFEVMVISSLSKLKELLAGLEENIELLLINSQLNIEELDLSRVFKTIPLLEIESTDTVGGTKGIYKYQPGDKLVNALLEQLSEVKTNIGLLPQNKYSEAKLVLFTSPSGGGGTTSTCIAAATTVAALGQRTLYLNFEGIPSHQLLLQYKEGTSSSALYYSLKKKSKSIALKLESNKALDVANGLSFLAPPDSLMDIDELNLEDIKLLFEAIRQSKSYDYVFIDTSSQFNNKSKLMLEECDYAVMIIPTSEMAYEKAYLLEREFNSNKIMDCIIRKLTIIQNEYPMLGGYTANSNVQFLGKRPEFLLPICDNLFIKKDKGLAFNMDSEFFRVISRYAGHLVKDKLKDGDYGGRIQGRAN